MRFTPSPELLRRHRSRSCVDQDICQCPSPQALHHAVQSQVINSSTWPLVASVAAEKRKHQEYGDAVRNGPHKLLPLVFETYGACGPELHHHLEAIREEEAWLDAHRCRQETPKMRQERLRLYKKAPFTARSHVNYWRQRFAVTNACGIANFINRAAQQLVLKNTF